MITYIDSYYVNYYIIEMFLLASNQHIMQMKAKSHKQLPLRYGW